MSKQDYCIVPTCKNTACNSPRKIFLKVPKDRNKRYLWLQAIGRTSDYSPKSCLFVCEDHFNLEQDMDNFLEFKMMGARKRMKPDVVPHLGLEAKNNAKISPDSVQPPSNFEKNTFLECATLKIKSVPNNNTFGISVSSKATTQSRDFAVHVHSSSDYKETKSLQILPRPDKLFTHAEICAKHFKKDRDQDWMLAQITVPHIKSVPLKTLIPEDFPEVTKKEPRKRRKVVKKFTEPENTQLKIIKEESLSPIHMENFEEIFVKEEHELAN